VDVPPGQPRPATDVDSALTTFQIEVAQMFFALPASEGFLLAGGAALAAQHLTNRFTQDLDFFTAPGRGEMTTARDELEHAVRARGWQVERIRDTATFCRLLIRGPHDLLIDLAMDSTPGLPATPSLAGPTFAPEELAARKVLALFGRAEARDFADVYELARTYDATTLIARAADLDGGFDLDVFASMLDTLARFTDNDIPVAATDVADLRSFFASWAAGLRNR
jgi:Nucleotidyl transferase AbiEii toxin, Type IV TA system